MGYCAMGLNVRINLKAPTTFTGELNFSKIEPTVILKVDYHKNDKH